MRKKESERVDLIHDFVFLLHRGLFGSILVFMRAYSVLFIFVISLVEIARAVALLIYKNERDFALLRSRFLFLMEGALITLLSIFFNWFRD